MKETPRQYAGRASSGRIRASAFAIATTVGGVAHAQYSASVDFASRNQYRGVDIGDAGPVVRSSLTVDSTAPYLDSAYAGVSATWGTRKIDLSNAEVLVGWSGRFNESPAMSSLGPDWGWDAGFHVLHYGGNSQRTFHETMIGLIAPGWSARAWWSPHYFGGPRSSVYVEANTSNVLADRWRVFAHAGVLRYGDGGSDPRLPNRVDGFIGLGYAVGQWDLRLMRDARRSIGVGGGDGTHGIQAVWVIDASIAF